ncbi:MAG: GntR family transcriptional regulator [Mesorhizobium sp.]|uniref:GntR family transcriptional regulator n=1 Tax=Mesorhizobium sp. TaxID=1871066 RepID=UPI000FE9ECBF|nr:GntR family transcriptional regulator [Mesorhizobium sp.]RWH78959.1 MAG: GntR family transcriptional regulator [Mesorhizobium sp.]RWH81604.1 MAG: GntR family transcriptional regulator [Mesorhizobium sp.]RWH90584.1 MAG: GntR family transcriptional regulator [Mesorhizobium sp.]RWH97940.1 MAG: GntR family transcriptional regulator [Mesorhizobium sp.]RWI00392.1 MAG: GntR family transcriptional regulator [Mesorhizobium sp.]
MHQKVSEMLIREIAAGRMIEGEKLPPERDMAAGLGIAVGTLRKALGDLERKGLLSRIQGSGNYVRSQPDVASVYSMFRLELLEGGGLPTARVLSVDRLAKPTDLPVFGSSSEAHRIRRLRSLGGKPAALEEIWLDGSRAETVAIEELSDSLYLYYRKALGIWILRAEDRVGVGQVPGWAPPEFGLAPSAAAGFIERTGWMQDGASAEFSRTWFDHGVARYVARLR